MSNLTLSWFESYLTNRTQQVIINENESETKTILFGVPQGSILSPLLFLLFIHDLPLNLEDSIHSVDLYADYTTLYDTASDRTILEKSLQHVLNLLNDWCLENDTLTDIDKPKLKLISSRQNRYTVQPLKTELSENRTNSLARN